MREITINKNAEVYYVANETITGPAIGLTDLVLTVKRPDNTIAWSEPMEEVGGGLYTFAYTPDVLGVWKESIVSVSNGDNALRVAKVVSYDITDSVIKIDVVDGKVDALDIKVDAVATDVTAVDTKVDAISTKTDEIVAKTDAVKAVVDSNSNKLDVIDTKINNLPTAKRYGYFA